MSAQHLISARRMRQYDLNIVLKWRNHPTVRCCMLNQNEISMMEHCAWYERMAVDDTRALFIVEEAEHPIGCVVFSNVSLNGTADWSFYADPESLSGTGRKVCTAALDVAFLDLKVHKVAGQVLDFNEASVRTHLRLGFTQEGVLREHCLINNKHHELLLFGLLSFEWLSRKASLS